MPHVLVRCYSAPVSVRTQPGIYVETLVRSSLEHVWQLTQTPGVHQRWDLRFSSIQYLPRESDAEPQRFLYETRIGAGLSIGGTGESVATRSNADGSAISSLQFASDDAFSLIREGAGYWRYLPTSDGLRFLTWYDYRVRFGVVGSLLDMGFRPLMGWATAWSFDRMRLWAERGVPPEVALRAAAMHAACRIVIAFVWLWHGLVPKLLLRDADERVMLAHAGLGAGWLPWVGGAEVLMAIVVLATWQWRGMFLLQALLMMAALAAVALQSPAYLGHAFTPVTLNLLVAVVAMLGWCAAVDTPFAGRCLRVDPRRTAAAGVGAV